MFKFLRKIRSRDILAPMMGKIINIENVPDEVFSQKMVGDGIAIEPTDGIVVAPCDGKIIQLFPTNHAIGIETEEGLQILIHIGIDTVELKGEGFKSYVVKDDYVKAGDKLLEVDLEYLKKKGKSIISPIVITNMELVDSLNKMKGFVKVSSDLIMKINLKAK
ncbi:PTS sugar transporter subunit IIA [Caloranaerobacter ferrireducens]|uniref:PTS sugar transporter subunit IIA n=1 Tax=Caloranaerobacter ferrireducens TaxID=1323370 RepID=UPI00084D38CB|nr:PTS glucose transporter subunit IIA [Caloranaerobacter ferrireducens]